MNTNSNISDRFLDLLVDGELDQSDRADLLSAMDGNPGAWRDCALRFVEAAVLRETFVRREQQPVREETGSSRDRGKRPEGRALRSLCVAAAIVGAALAGFLARDRTGTGEQIAPEGASKLHESEALAQFAAGYRKALEEGIVWERQLNWDGATSYVTRQKVPGFIRDAMLRAGHRVEREERMVLLGSPGDSGTGWQLPVSETRIIENRPL
jgi:hypothetical protein